ncbi:M48 family metalloprotease [Oligoflexia bacterium]|nr:M48 family metalloprotease [Oligoflexia bacterium]
MFNCFLKGFFIAISLIIHVSVLYAEVCLDAQYSPIEITTSVHAQETKSQEQLWQDFAKKILCQIAVDNKQIAIELFPTLKILHTPRPDAFVLHNGTFVFSSGMLTLVHNISEYAFLIAHELAHLLLEHWPPIKFLGKDGNIHALNQKEADADILALEMLKNAGFHQEAALGLLARLSSHGQEYGLRLDKIHPNLLQRTKKLQKLFEAKNTSPPSEGTQQQFEALS